MQFITDDVQTFLCVKKVSMESFIRRIVLDMVPSEDVLRWCSSTVHTNSRSPEFGHPENIEQHAVELVAAELVSDNLSRCLCLRCNIFGLKM